MNKLVAFLTIGFFTLASLTHAESLLSKSSVEKDLEKATTEEGLSTATTDTKVDQQLSDLNTKIESQSSSSAAKDSGEPKKSLFSQAKDAALKTATTIDWSNLSWDKVSQIPYDDKTQLLAWAGSQVDSWKEKLTQAALDKGQTSLSALGDSGWQGALKSVVSALDGVRKSNPETWTMARGALVSAWGKFETVATDYLSQK